MGLFSGIEDTKATQGGVYFLPGSYVVEILKAATIQSRKGDSLFIVETQVIKSDNAERGPGSNPAWIVNFRHDAALGNVKGFIAAANNADVGEVTEEVCEYAVSDDNPLKGVRLAVSCVNKRTRDGGEFTLHQWRPLSEREAELYC